MAHDPTDNDFDRLVADLRDELRAALPERRRGMALTPEELVRSNRPDGDELALRRADRQLRRLAEDGIVDLPFLEDR